ncbi:hypothetical protein DB32_001282 [Sandaracinus amylolyticus]|uniref:Uncharacterized protein n=1 Tax=Sandaracinus amylolyticus TaxID=927083 RepID=A0A0F6W0G6_9BACT|nr:hypothetical protein DB32_001282 [Sandaracinus amylolyticus]
MIPLQALRQSDRGGAMSRESRLLGLRLEEDSNLYFARGDRGG